MRPDGPPPEVAQAFDAMPTAARATLMQIRALIAEEARAPDVGQIDECLKWGQPAYVTYSPRTGTTLRLATQNNAPAIFTHCQSSVMESFRPMAPQGITIDGTRAAILDASSPLPKEGIRALLRLALTYHLKTRA